MGELPAEALVWVFAAPSLVPPVQVIGVGGQEEGQAIDVLEGDLAVACSDGASLVQDEYLGFVIQGNLVLAALRLSVSVLGERTRGRYPCLLYTSPSPRDRTRSRMPSSA